MQALQIIKFLEGVTRTRLLHHELRGIGVVRAKERHPVGSLANELTSCKAYDQRTESESGMSSVRQT